MKHLDIANTVTTHISRRKLLIASAASVFSIAACSTKRLSEHPKKACIQTTRAQRKWMFSHKYADFKTIEIPSGMVKLWCMDSGGNGVPIVLVHPFSGSAEVWAYQQPYLVERGYRVISYSRRGHFGSTAVGYKPHESATADLQAVVNFLGLEKFHLLGIGGGADILPDFAASYPEKLLSLIIGCTIGKPGEDNYNTLKKNFLTKEFRALPAALKELSPSYRAAFPAGVEQWQAIHKRALLKRNAMKMQTDVTPQRIAQIRTPTLLFTGDADLYMPPFMLSKYAKFWHKPEITIFSEAGHAPHWEQPEAFNSRLLAFISQFNDT